MNTIKARGLVIREYEAGESDKRLLLLCKGHGRVMVYARGVRKPTAKHLASAQLFTYSDFVLAEGRGFYSLTQADVIESFYNLRTDYDRLRAAHLVAEVCERTLWENVDCDRLLLLALKSLSRLAKGDMLPKQVTAVFLTRFFDFYGLRPQVDECVACGLPLSEMKDGMYFGREGLLCDLHSAGGIAISPAAAAAFFHVVNSELIQAFRFNVLPEVIDDMHQGLKVLWDNYFEWGLRSL